MLTPERLAELRARKAELLAGLAAGRQGFDGGDVRVVDEAELVARRGDDDLGSHGDEPIPVSDRDRPAPNQPDAERLERLPLAQSKQFIGEHADRVSPVRPEANTGALPDEWREHFAERGAIMEHDAPDAHPTREAADGAAWADTIRQTGLRDAALGWIVGDRLAALEADLQGLVMPREGWMPEAWGDYLRYQADRCAALHPDLAGRYRRAAEVLRQS